MNLLNRKEDGLMIFDEPVRVNKNLKKWQLIESSDNCKDTNSVSLDDDITPDEYIGLTSTDFNIYLGREKKKLNAIRTSTAQFITTPNIINTNNFINNSSSKLNDEKKNFIKRAYSYICNLFKNNKTYSVNIIDFFKAVKLQTVDEANKYVNRIKPYMEMIAQANKMGQTALIEELTAKMIINKYESILYANNFDKKVTSEQVVEFAKLSERGVKLDYVENFGRPIPPEVIDLKNKADDLLVFDNYAIMYYDPDNKVYKKTQKQIEEERRDPILFGLIAGSTDLYYIADWIDDFCDLTLDKFADTINMNTYDLKISKNII